MTNNDEQPRYFSPSVVSDERLSDAQLAELRGIFTLGESQQVTVTWANTLTPKAVDWGWQGWLPVGMLARVLGEEGHGKSALTVALATQLTRGTLAGAYESKPQRVFFATSEDSWEHTVIPRLMAAGADLSHVGFVNVKTKDDEHGLELPKDAGSLGAQAAEAGVVGLFIDPMVEFLGDGLSAYKAQDVRRAYQPLKAQAEQHGFFVLGVSHLNREPSTNARQRSGDSLGFRQIVRAHWVLGLDPDDPTGDDGESRILAFDKGNLGRFPKSRRVHIDDVTVEIEGRQEQIVRAQIGSECEYRATDVLDAQRRHERTDKQNEAILFLRGHLPGVAKEIKQQAADAGIATRTLERAKDALGVESKQHGHTWHWTLPDEPAI
jgi:hypothetical protein